MKQYDVIIVGAGVSGLVCGCYLAKEGLNVVIVEQSDHPGGYCTSFTRGPHTFNAGVHYLGGLTRGLMGKIVNEIELSDEGLLFFQPDPTDKIIMPETTSYIRSHSGDTIKEFIKTFPREKRNIKAFFKSILEEDIIKEYAKMKKTTFQQTLDKSFTDPKLKATLAMLLGNIGLPASKITAVTAIMLFKEFILDPGYYTRGGIQAFPDTLARRFKHYGGTLLLSKKVERIVVEDNKIRGIAFDDETITSDIVVSNADATETFIQLVDNKNTPEAYSVEVLECSESIFALYVGLKVPIQNAVKELCNIWYSTTYDTEKLFSFPKENVTKKKLPGLMVFLSCPYSTGLENDPLGTITALTTAPFETKEFWDEIRDGLAERMLAIIVELLPGIEQHIASKFNATPWTFYKYTTNKKGAAYGWAPTIDQSNSALLPQESSVKGLYLTGHWCTKGIGTGCISGVASLGRNAAKLVMERKGMKWKYPLFFR
ncbi:phytoene desaturase family protein [Candidatus Omnitrophota bacterium]